MTENDFLTAKEVAALVGCHYATIPDLVKRGHFPGARKLDPTKRNSPYKIPRQAVEAYLKFQVVTPDGKSNE